VREYIADIAAGVMDHGYGPYVPGVNCWTCGRFVGRDGHIEIEHFEMSDEVASVAGQCGRCCTAETERERDGMTTVNEWEGWGILRDGDWYHIEANQDIAVLYADGSEQVARVKVREAEDGTYYGWQDTGYTGLPEMIWPRRILFEMCFPYGPDAEVKRGRGRIVRMTAEQAPTNAPRETP
jgi:hypothetical protein